MLNLDNFVSKLQLPFFWQCLTTIMFNVVNLPCSRYYSWGYYIQLTHTHLLTIGTMATPYIIILFEIR